MLDLVDRSGRRLARLPNATRVRSSSVWSADGQRLVYSVGPAGVQPHLLRVADARGRLRFSRHGDDALWAEASPRLAIITGSFGDVGSTLVVDERGREIRRFAGRAAALSPDGKTLVLARPGGKTWLASVDTGKLRLLPGAEPASFSPDSKHLEQASTSGQGALVVSVPAGRVEGHLSAFGTWLDSHRLVALGRPGGDATIMTSGGRVLRRLQLLPAGESAATFDVAQGCECARLHAPELSSAPALRAACRRRSAANHARERRPSLPGTFARWPADRRHRVRYALWQLRSALARRAPGRRLGAGAVAAEPGGRQYARELVTRRHAHRLRREHGPRHLRHLRHRGGRLASACAARRARAARNPAGRRTALRSRRVAKASS